MVLMFGLDNSGKTTLLYKIADDRKEPPLGPTLVMEVEKVTILNSIYEFWTIPAGVSLRPLYPTYAECDNCGIVFVINAIERDRLTEVKSILDPLLSCDATKNLPILIYANKQDLPGCMSDSEIIEACDLKPSRNRNIKFQPCSALTGEGISAGLEWLASPTPVSE